MNNITYSLVKVPEAITGQVVYRAVVQTRGVIGKEELVQRLAVRTKQDASLWGYFLDALAEELATQILAGYRVNLGQLTTGFAVKGSFLSEDDRWDPARHQLVATIRALDPLKSALSAVLPENITLGLVCSLYSVMDKVTKHLSEITGSDQLLLQGLNLGINPDAEDEFVALVDPVSGESKAVATVLASDAQTIDCRFDEPPAQGIYTLVVSCRNGARESLKPAIAEIKNVVVKTA